MKKASLSLICILTCFLSYSQYNLDSLERKLSETQGAEKAKTYNELFKAYINLSPTAALENARKAFEISTEVNDKKGIAASLNNLGIIYKNQGIYDKALEYYLQSLRYSTEIGDQFMIASTMNNIGTIYSLKSIFDKALIYFIESYEIFVKLNDKVQIMNALNNIGNAYFENGRDDKALAYYQKAIKISRELKKENTIFDPLNNMGNIHFTLANYPEAHTLYDQSFTIANKTGNRFGQALASSNIGITLMKMKRFKEAEGQLKMALAIAAEINDNLILKNTYASLSDLYYQQQRYKEAFDALTIHNEHEDVLYNAESSRKIAQLETAVQMEEKDKELEILHKQSEIDQLVIKNSRIIILVAIMGAILLIAIGFIIYNLQKEKRILFQG